MFLNADTFNVRFTPIFQAPLELETFVHEVDPKLLQSDFKRSKYFSQLCNGTKLISGNSSNHSIFKK
jgi:hypothetical protein